MPLKKTISCFSLFVLTLLFLRVSAQTTDSLSEEQTTHGTPYYSVLQVYHSYLKPETGLFRGAEYAGYPFLFSSGHPFFGEPTMRKGTLWYAGVYYENVSLMYQEIMGVVVKYDAENLY